MLQGRRGRREWPPPQRRKRPRRPLQPLFIFSEEPPPIHDAAAAAERRPRLFPPRMKVLQGDWEGRDFCAFQTLRRKELASERGGSFAVPLSDCALGCSREVGFGGVVNSCERQRTSLKKAVCSVVNIAIALINGETRTFIEYLYHNSLNNI